MTHTRTTYVCIMPSLRIRAEYYSKYWSRVRDDKALRRRHDRRDDLLRHGCGVGPPSNELLSVLSEPSSEPPKS